MAPVIDMFNGSHAAQISLLILHSSCPQLGWNSKLLQRCQYPMQKRPKVGVFSGHPKNGLVRMITVATLNLNGMTFTAIKTTAAVFDKALINHLGDKGIRLAVTHIGKVNILIILG